MRQYPNPKQFWRNTRALEKAREYCLEWARRELRRRRENSPADNPQVFQAAHSGQAHREFFHAEFPQIIRSLPSGFRALEAGAGLGWIAALLAAHSQGSVLATEIMYGGDTPYKRSNVYTFARLMEADPKLADVIRIDREMPERIRFSPRISFARAAAEALPAQSSSLDFVYSQNCVEHIPGLKEYFAEAARTLKIGGLFYTATEPLYYSLIGHHLEDICPLPWGHLLWEAEELAEIAVREAGEREWSEGVPLNAGHLRELLLHGLNYASPREIRGKLLAGPWSIDGWLDIVDDNHYRLAREMGLNRALSGVSEEELFLFGLRFRLRRIDKRKGPRLPMRLSFPTRRKLNKLRRRR